MHHILGLGLGLGFLLAQKYSGMDVMLGNGTTDLRAALGLGAAFLELVWCPLVGGFGGGTSHYL